MTGILLLFSLCFFSEEEMDAQRSPRFVQNHTAAADPELNALLWFESGASDGK